MWIRTPLRIGWRDLAYGLYKCLVPDQRQTLQAQVEADWSAKGDALACFSVRSGFDLLLQALRLPAGSEVLFSALNIKAMPKIAVRHGLVPVPVDLDIELMAPVPASMKKAITPRTRAIVVAHLFGTRLDLDPVIALAKEHNLLLIEDCAQAFDGHAYTGHQDADVAMFSFGSLKTATALGGALVKVRDPGLRDRMRAIEARYPVQSDRKYAARVLKFAGLKVITSPLVFGALARLFRLLQRDYEEPVTDAVRGVAKLGTSEQLRRRPSAALLAVLYRRLRTWPAQGLDSRVRTGKMLLEMIDGYAVYPARRNPIHSFWVFPVVVENPKAIMQAMRNAGFDAADLRKSAAIAPPEDRPELDPITAREVLSHLLILPCYPEMPRAELAREAELFKHLAKACDVGNALCNTSSHSAGVSANP